MHRSLHRRGLQQVVSQVHVGEAEVEEDHIHDLLVDLRPSLRVALLCEGLSWLGVVPCFSRSAQIVPMDLCFTLTSEDYCFLKQDQANTSSPSCEQ